jgi:uncharacterized protein (DUF4415 family)
MNGSRNMKDRDEALAALAAASEADDFVWDGRDEEDRPATLGELHAGVENDRRKRGRPVSPNAKVSTTIRFDADILDAFRAEGPGWQSRMNSVLRDWLRTHQHRL